MLTMIGLGLWDEKDITQRGLEKAREADVLYLENYTSDLGGTDKQKLEKEIGKEIQYADREFIEKGRILNYAQTNDVALLVPGDPFVATTHSDLVIRAREKNIKVESVHNSSIYSAIAETGLQLYKFGKTTSITFWESNYQPKSFYKALKENKERGLHTLMLLDIKKDEGKYLTAKEAMRTLLDIEKEKEEGIFTRETEAIIVSQLGSPKRQIKYGKVKKLLQADHGPTLHSIVVPGDMHEREEEYLEPFRVGDDTDD